jgi:hypothetical protein
LCCLQYFLKYFLIKEVQIFSLRSTTERSALTDPSSNQVVSLGLLLWDLCLSLLNQSYFKTQLSLVELGFTAILLCYCLPAPSLRFCFASMFPILDLQKAKVGVNFLDAQFNVLAWWFSKTNASCLVKTRSSKSRPHTKPLSPV